MDVFIYGTKDGARPLYQTSQGTASVFDDCRKFGNGLSKGQTAYSIEITRKGVAYTKWIIVDDVLRGSIGFIAFAVEVENGKKLESEDVVGLLNQLVTAYGDQYLTDSFEIKEAKENWSFVNKLRDDYQGMLQQGELMDVHAQASKDAAFIYYSSPEKLQKYFDVPYHEEYKPFKRIFFVDEKYQGKKENPLNTLQHNEAADLTTLKILENIRCRVSILSGVSGISTKVTSGGVKVENGSWVHPEDILTITFSKKNHHDHQPIHGTLEQLKENSGGHVKVNDNNTRLTIAPPSLNEFDAKEETFHFDIRSSTSERNEDPVIVIKRKGDLDDKKVEKKQFTFKGEELDEEWEVKIDGKSDKKIIIPNKSESNFVTIEIKEKPKPQINQKEPSSSPKKSNHTGKRDKRKLGNTKKWIWVIVSIAAFTFVAAFSAYWAMRYNFPENIFGSSSTVNEVNETSEYNRIVEYVDGIDLKEGTINAHIGTVKTKLNANGGTAQNLPWATLLKRLEEKKKIRYAINNGNIQALQSSSNSYNYSENQEYFKEAVEDIDSLYVEKISDSMKGANDKLSSMNIDQVTLFLKNYQELLRIEEEVKSNSDIDFFEKKREVINDKLKLMPEDALPSANKVREGILEYIEKQIRDKDTADEGQRTVNKKSESNDTANKDQAQKQPKAIATKLTSPSKDKQKDNEIVRDFENEFWQLVEGKKEIEEYNDLYSKYVNSIPYTNETRIVLDDIIQKSFKDLKDIPVMDLKKDVRKDIKKLKALLDEQK